MNRPFRLFQNWCYNIAVGRSGERINIASSPMQYSLVALATYPLVPMDTFITISAPGTVDIPADQEDPGGSGGQAYCVVSQSPSMSLPTRKIQEAQVGRRTASSLERLLLEIT